MSENTQLFTAREPTYQPLFDLIDHGESHRAILNASRLQENGDQSADLLRVLGIAGIHTNQLEMAVSALGALVTSGRGDILDRFSLGKALEETGNYQAALNLYQKINVEDPENADAHVATANCLAKLERWEDSIASSKRALSINPKNTFALWNLGAIFQGLGNNDEAEAAYRELLPLDPPFLTTELYCNLGGLLRDRNELETSRKLLEAALATFPDCEKTKFQLGFTLRALKHWKAAKECFELIKDESKSTSKIIECSYHLGDLDRVKTELAKAAIRYPNDVYLSAVSAFASQQNGWADIHPFCTNSLNMIQRSSLSEYYSDLPQALDTLLAKLDTLEAKWEPSKKATVKGYQANGILKAPFAEIQQIKDVITAEINKYRESYEGWPCGLIEQWPDEFEIKAWYVSFEEGGHQAAHIHRNGWLSGVLYLKTIETPELDEGAIKFGLHGYDFPRKDIASPTKTIQPTNGDIVVFPSNLFHETVPVSGKERRCVIAFDMVPTKSADIGIQAVTRYLPRIQSNQT